mmetsp:Transcript_25410/g.59160  ORF Transcript_25410/g.59160 Transcript_25410/m.59160 type:complete len:202 (+) Transcript_25410:2845-3450(+)
MHIHIALRAALAFGTFSVVATVAAGGPLLHIRRKLDPSHHEAEGLVVPERGFVGVDVEISVTLRQPRLERATQRHWSAACHHHRCRRARIWPKRGARRGVHQAQGRAGIASFERLRQHDRVGGGSHPHPRCTAGYELFCVRLRHQAYPSLELDELVAVLHIVEPIAVVGENERVVFRQTGALGVVEEEHRPAAVLGRLLND